MSLSVLKTWSAGEVLTAADLNNEFSNIVSNATSLISPVTANFDLDSFALILDGDGDTTITADSDDRIDVAVGGTDAVLIGHDATNTSAWFLIDPGAFTAQASTDIARLHIENDSAVTVPAGTTAIASALRVEEPNLTATGTITSAVTVYIAAAPTEGGTNNYALWVDAGATQLDGTLAVGGATTLSGDLTLAVSDSRTNSVDVPVIIRSTTSGTPAAGIGTGIQFDAESGDEDPSVFGRLDFAASDVGAGTEDTYLSVLLRTAGAAVGERYRLVATGAFNAVFTHANSADRTYTWPDADLTVADAANIPSAASQAEQETGTATDVYVTPGRQHFHQSAAKMWAEVDRSAGTPALSSPSYNVTSVTDDGAANTIVTIATDFSTAVYANGASASVTDGVATPHSKAAGAFDVDVRNTGGTGQDTQNFTCWAFGDHA